ncbi:MAG TPA: carboxypeptidase-like regulatory domain-containing protein [candidate division Zixibacteria bacterium]|nr:carboxypeptidase-like regulatory domain-containing protein [candidate division Zixibacteria bacterium]
MSRIIIDNLILEGISNEHHAQSSLGEVKKVNVKPKNSTSAGVFLLCLVFALSCEENGLIDGEKSFEVSGKVTDSITTLPIDSVLMSWGDTLVQTLSTFTDSSGNFWLQVPQSTDTIYARKANYKTKGREIINLNSNISNFDFEVVSE